MRSMLKKFFILTLLLSPLFLIQNEKANAGVFVSGASNTGSGNGGGTWNPRKSNYNGGLPLDWAYGSGQKSVLIPRNMMLFTEQGRY